jgi:release factor glutamine methyltransferase
MLSHPEDPLTANQVTRYHALLARRARHEPIQYILGEQEFYGLRFEVSPAVLIPRPETEHLVEAALARLPTTGSARIADVGTGSGAIAVALAHSRLKVEIVALDVSPSALHVATRNAEAHGVSARVLCLQSNLLAAVQGQRFAMIVSNPPYVATTEQLELQVACYEPHQALFAGEDGLGVYRHLIPQARQALDPGGWLLLEIGAGQREAVHQLLSGWQGIEFIEDLQSIPRVAVARAADHISYVSG